MPIRPRDVYDYCIHRYIGCIPSVGEVVAFYSGIDLGSEYKSTGLTINSRTKGICLTPLNTSLRELDYVGADSEKDMVVTRELPKTLFDFQRQKPVDLLLDTLCKHYVYNFPRPVGNRAFAAFAFDTFVIDDNSDQIHWAKYALGAVWRPLNVLEDLNNIT